MTSRPWPADALERWPLDRLVASARNARTHSEPQIAQIAASMQQFGWTNPVLVDESGVIIAGHGRVLAARKLTDDGVQGFTSVPTMIARGWSDTERQAYLIADNKLPMNAEWHMATLSESLLQLDAANFDLQLLGFSDAELSNILAPVGEINRDEEWRGMPEYDVEDKMAFRTIKLHFRNQADVDAFAELLEQSVTEKTKFLWFPANEVEHVADKRYVSGD